MRHKYEGLDGVKVIIEPIKGTMDFYWSCTAPAKVNKITGMANIKNRCSNNKDWVVGHYNLFVERLGWDIGELNRFKYFVSSAR